MLADKAVLGRYFPFGVYSVIASEICHRKCLFLILVSGKLLQFVCKEMLEFEC